MQPLTPKEEKHLTYPRKFETMNDIVMFSTLLQTILPEGLPEEINKRHDELRDRSHKLERLQDGLETERGELHLRDDPFAAAADYRDRVLDAWRTEAALWRDVGLFAADMAEQLRQYRILVAGELTIAQNRVRRDYYAEHLEEAPDYVVGQDEAVANVSFRVALIKAAEGRWATGLARSEPNARACDRRVEEAIEAILTPILDPVA